MKFRYKRLIVTFMGEDIISVLFGPVRFLVTEPQDEELSAVNHLRSEVWRLIEGINLTHGLGTSPPDDRVDVRLENEAYDLLVQTALKASSLDKRGFLTEVRRLTTKALTEPVRELVEIEREPTYFQRIKNWFRQLPDRLSEHPSSYTYTGDTTK